MTTVTDSNVHNIAVKGTFDDCQDIVKALFADKDFNEEYHLGAVNSINWARILAQIVYYFLAYFHVMKDLGPRDPGALLQFVVPTGNFGDILAGWYAKRMGLPMDILVVATNANDILARFWATGRYEKSVSVTLDTADTFHSPTGSVNGVSQSTDASGVKETLSPAMDILVSSNFERLLWYLAYESSTGVSDTEKLEDACSTVNRWMQNLKSDGRVIVSAEALELARRDFRAERVADEQARSLHTVGSHLANFCNRYSSLFGFTMRPKMASSTGRMYQTRTLRWASLRLVGLPLRSKHSVIPPDCQSHWTFKPTECLSGDPVDSSPSQVL